MNRQESSTGDGAFKALYSTDSKNLAPFKTPVPVLQPGNRAKAMHYALGRWAALTRYVDNSPLEIGRVGMWRSDRRRYRRSRHP